ncbi:MAG: RNA-binding S4 domain-containing protein [Acidimicrobiales bacterium]
MRHPLAPSLASTRVDRWLCAVRVFKTRADATAACRAGHVQVNEATAKPSTPVSIGDVVEVNAGGRQRLFDVTRVVERRVGAAVAVECFLDRSPARPPTERETGVVVIRGEGRPTKKERREFDRLRGH